jgi:hypothetical protein
MRENRLSGLEGGVRFEPASLPLLLAQGEALGMGPPVTQAPKARFMVTR